MGRLFEGNCRVKDKTILGATLKEAVFSGGITRLERAEPKTHFSHYAQVFICFWPSKSKVCVISALFSLRDIHDGRRLGRIPPRCALDVRRRRGRGGDRQRGEDKEAATHLALHQHWEESWMVWANDVVLKLAKHWEHHTLSLWPAVGSSVLTMISSIYIKLELLHIPAHF